tara:strand:+ start:12211 stop:12513 length:303 start_codon:yes stop_codon:yes gene_type:complete
MNHSTQTDTLTILVEEDLSSTTAPGLLEEWGRLLSQATDQKHVCLDLEKVNMIDSQGLNLVISFYKECTQQELQFSVTGCSKENKRLFSIFKLTELLNIQ